MRNLTVSDSLNLKGSREFNHLRVNNLDEFLNSYANNLEYYASPFEILADLERKIKFENKPDSKIFCSYKEDGDIIFDLVAIREEDGIRIVEYEYSGSIS